MHRCQRFLVLFVRRTEHPSAPPVSVSETVVFNFRSRDFRSCRRGRRRRKGMRTARLRRLRRVDLLESSCSSRTGSIVDGVVIWSSRAAVSWRPTRRRTRTAATARASTATSRHRRSSSARRPRDAITPAPPSTHTVRASVSFTY